jgi:hypothetical protein
MWDLFFIVTDIPTYSVFDFSQVQKNPSPTLHNLGTRIFEIASLPQAALRLPYVIA